MTIDKSKLYVQIMTGLLLLNSLHLFAYAQFGTQQRKSATSEATRSSGCETKYDRFKGKTTLTSALRVIYRTSSPREELSLSAGIIKNNEGNNDGEVELLFLSVAERWRYHDQADVNFIVDGKKLQAGTAYAMGGVPVMSQVQEKMKLMLSNEKFLQIINGREVEMQMGPTETTLKTTDLDALRGFAKCAGLLTE